MNMTTPNAPRAWNADDPRRQRQAEKRVALLDAAQVVFLTEGYAGTSMQAVADRAGVSKMTLYRHFADKEQLFLATFFEQCMRSRDRATVAPARDVAEATAALEEFARDFVLAFTDPGMLALFRMLIGETGRFPELGKTFYDHGPRLEIADIEVILSGLLPPAEVRGRAQAFFYLALGDAYHQLLLGCFPDESSAGVLEAQIREAARLILPEHLAAQQTNDSQTTGG
jgi:TetR/AcrR family transcriptional regulator, mexJK operon transcriptional repressor